jgi:tetratricopeptide (TPR) repeat protein
MIRFVRFVLAAALVALCAPGRPAHAQSAQPPCTFPSGQPAGRPCAVASWPVHGADAVSQKLIDRGVAMLYGFNGGEARAYFRQAIAHQAALGRPLAFPWWGIAESYTIDINLPWTAETESQGREAVAHALAAESGPAPEVRDLVRAATFRFSGSRCKDELDAYGSALRSAAERHRSSANFLVVAGFALLTMDNADNPDPAQQSACPPPAPAGAALAEEINHSGGSSTPNYERVVSYMDAARKLQPWNLGLHHLSIHEHEYASDPTHAERWKHARHDADALASYSYPDGLSHLPHMAGHIFARDGQYQRTIATNTVALDNDHRYYGEGDGDGQHYLNRYHTHDIDFVLYSLTTAGRNDEARSLAAGTFRPPDVSGKPPIEQYPNGRPLLSLLLRLHDTKNLPSPHPDDAIRQPWRARLASLSAARQGYVRLAIEIADRSSRDIFDGTLSYLTRAQLAKRGPLPAPTPPPPGAKRYECTGVLDCYAKAYQLNAGAYNGDPKDYWYVPVGEGFAAELLRAKQYEAALRVFRGEMKRFANDPHLEWGAWQACKALASSTPCPDTAALESAYREHWKGAAELTLDDLG